MRSILLILASAFLLSGCSFFEKNTRPSDVVVKYEYVVRKAPDELYIVPPFVTKLDITTATQKDVAQWVTDNEARMQEIEAKLEQVRKFFEAPATTAEQSKAVK